MYCNSKISPSVRHTLGRAIVCAAIATSASLTACTTVSVPQGTHIDVSSDAAELLESRAKTAAAKLLETNTNLALVSGELETKNSQRTALLENLENLNRRLDAADRALAETIRKQTAAADEVARLAGQVHRLNGEITVAVSVRDTAQNTRDSAILQRDHATTVLATLEAQVRQLQADKTAVTDATKMLLLKNADLHHQIATDEDHLKALNTEIQMSQARWAKISADLNAAQARFKVVQAENREHFFPVSNVSSKSPLIVEHKTIPTTMPKNIPSAIRNVTTTTSTTRPTAIAQTPEAHPISPAVSIADNRSSIIWVIAAGTILMTAIFVSFLNRRSRRPTLVSLQRTRDNHSASIQRRLVKGESSVLDGALRLTQSRYTGNILAQPVTGYTLLNVQGIQVPKLPLKTGTSFILKGQSESKYTANVKRGADVVLA